MSEWITDSANNIIHRTAIISSGSSLGRNNTIGPWTLLGRGVTIGDNNWIGSHVVIGTPPEHRKHHLVAVSAPDQERVVIGNGNVIHEFVAIQLGIDRKTVLESDILIMGKVSLGHGSFVGRGSNIATGTAVAGEVHIRPGVNLGLNSSIHQDVYIGEHAMVGMGSLVSRDIPPFALIAGNPGRNLGLNRVGLDRLGLDGNWSEKYWEILSEDVEVRHLCSGRVLEAFEAWFDRPKID